MSYEYTKGHMPYRYQKALKSYEYKDPILYEYRKARMSYKCMTVTQFYGNNKPRL